MRRKKLKKEKGRQGGRCWFWFVFLFCSCLVSMASDAKSQEAASLAAPETPQIQQVGLHNKVQIRAVGEPGHYIGFDMLADDKLVAPVRFTSHGLIFSAKAVATTRGLNSNLVFANLQAAPESGLTLERSHITVTLRAQQYPAVAFDLCLISFDAKLWQQALGLQPFHFLTLGMPDATIWHQQGWLNATPRADLFPLLLDVHDGRPAVSAAPYNREWSNTPPLSAHPLPIIGLWSPAHRLYAAWDFLPSRLENNSAHDIATGFCNRLIVSTDPNLPATLETVPAFSYAPDTETPQSKNGQPPPKRDMRTRKPLTPDQLSQREYDRRGVSKFVALVYPQGGKDYQQLVYPLKGAHIASHATLMFSADLSDSDDPNRFLWQHWWNTPMVRARLPHVPPVNDLGWIPDALHLQHLPSAPLGGLITKAESPFQIPGTVSLSGWGWHNESAVEAPAHNGDRTRLTELQADTRILLRYAKHFTVDKEACVYWDKPLAGESTPAWGGEVATTLHNANGWAAGRLFLDFYRLEREKQSIGKDSKESQRVRLETNSTESTKSAGGINPGTSQGLTKNEISHFLQVIDGVFNWTKHLVWTRNEFADRPSAPSAVGGTLAVAFLLDYYFTFKDDQLDGERRTRALQALEMARTFTYRYMILHIGDNEGQDTDTRAFLWASDAESHAGSESIGAADTNEVIWNLDSLAQVAVHTGDPVLMWALQGSLLREPLFASDANRLGYGNALSMIEPVGETQVRALCGEKAAMAFDRNTHDILVTNYRCTHPGDFAFTLHRAGAGALTPYQSGHSDVIDVTVTFPYVDLSKKSVAVRHGNIMQRTLQQGVEVLREPNALWSFIVKGLREGDTLIVGSPNLSQADRLPSAPPLSEILERHIKKTLVVQRH